jgi:hypothetical protein
MVGSHSLARGAINASMFLARRLRVESEKVAEAPPTPTYDRLLELCDSAGVAYPVLSMALGISTERNELAHHPPPSPRNNQNAVTEWSSGRECILLVRITKLAPTKPSVMNSDPRPPYTSCGNH